MQKFFSKYQADALDPEATVELFDDIKTLLITGIKEPSVRALMAFLMLTGARIHEVIPNPKYQTAVLYEHLIPDEQGILVLPLTEKKRKKKEVDKRFAIIWDRDLWNIVLDYIARYGKKWNTPLLKRTWFNPTNFLEFLSIRMNKKALTEKEKQKAGFYKRYIWLFRKKSDKKIKGIAPIERKLKEERSLKEEARKWLVNDVVFPLHYKAIYNNYLSKLKIQAKLVDIKKGGKLVEGERGLYTHIGREFFVNTLLRKGKVSEWEIARILNWSKIENINFYIRRDISLIVNLARKIGVSKAISEEEREKAIERSEEIHEAVKEIEEKYQNKKEEIFSRK